MLNALGKELRKIRVDKDHNINDMAKKLGISISYLSAIESGKRKIPAGMVETVIKKYHLTKAEADRLKAAETESSTAIEINLANMTLEQKKLAFALSRKLDEISDEDCLEILRHFK